MKHLLCLLSLLPLLTLGQPHGQPLISATPYLQNVSPQLQPSCTRATIVVSKRRKELSVQAFDVNGRVIFSK